MLFHIPPSRTVSQRPKVWSFWPCMEPFLSTSSITLSKRRTLEAVDAFLFPGFKRCTSKITPVRQQPIVK
jgi:hypothetical protein